METLTLAEIAGWFGAGCGLAVVPYGLLYGVRAVMRLVAMVGDDESSSKYDG